MHIKQITFKITVDLLASLGGYWARQNCSDHGEIFYNNSVLLVFRLYC